MNELKPKGIYACYQAEYDNILASIANLNQRMDLSIHMMSDLVAAEDGGELMKEHALFIKDFIKDCDAETKLRIVKYLDI